MVSNLFIIRRLPLYTECKTEEEKKEIRKKAEEYLARAEVIKQEAREGEGDYIELLCVLSHIILHLLELQWPQRESGVSK